MKMNQTHYLESNFVILVFGILVQNVNGEGSKVEGLNNLQLLQHSKNKVLKGRALIKCRCGFSTFQSFMIMYLQILHSPMVYITLWYVHAPSVVYFDQRLGAAHSKRWSKSSFSAFLLQKYLKKQEFCSKFQQYFTLFKLPLLLWGN